MDIKVRQAYEEDLDRILEIERRSFSDPWSRDSFERNMENELNVVWVAELGGVVAGYLAAFVVPTVDAEILRIATAPEYRRERVAHNLVNFMLCYCNLIASARIKLEVRADNVPAIALYKSFKFAKDGVRKNYYDGEIDAILMSRIVSVENVIMELEYNN